MSAPTTTITLTEVELSTVLSALVAKSLETRSYLSSYRDVADKPRDTDRCCKAHLAQFERRHLERDSLQERQDMITALLEKIENTEETAMHALSITLTSNQITAWAGRELTGAETERLAKAIEHSSIPEAVGTIVDGFDEQDRDPA